MKKNILLIPIYFLILLNFGCKKSPTEVVDNTQPGRRDYAWTVDTLKIPFTVLYSIWGSNPNDVWAVGPGGGLDQTIWHYDGTKWKTDGVSRGISPNVVWGFEKNNVWLGGNEGRIWHNKGEGWLESINYKRNGYRIGFFDIWGDAANNLFAAGYADSSDVRKGILLHYNGDKWNETNMLSAPYTLQRIRRGIKTSNKYYLTGVGTYSNEVTYAGLFEYNGEKFNKLYEEPFNPSTWTDIHEIDGYLFAIIGKEIKLSTPQGFSLYFRVENQNFGGQIFGRSKKDIFIRMLDGIAHYNGTDIEYLYKFSSQTSISGAAIFDKEVFFLALDVPSYLNIIIHGRLKE
ncbi:MAG: hypothetical protein COW85_14170 [Ignavibacteria bacterium CG22_combo_CG10-13_8_21_14_all_37_15]|nr:MAG: hypothetical protein COW85_14170 [Ignavibacteria bacterium CG22_combo_CG10-13_8_21_14_all_37_15]